MTLKQIFMLETCLLITKTLQRPLKEKARIPALKLVKKKYHSVNHQAVTLMLSSAVPYTAKI